MLIGVVVVGVGMAVWRISNLPKIDRQRLLHELEQEREHSSWGIDCSVPEFRTAYLWLAHEATFESEQGETRHVLVFMRLGGIAYPGDNPKLIVITDRWYKILHSLSYRDHSGSVLSVTVSNAVGEQIVAVHSLGRWSGVTKRFVIDEGGGGRPVSKESGR